MPNDGQRIFIQAGTDVTWSDNDSAIVPSAWRGTPHGFHSMPIRVSATEDDILTQLISRITKLEEQVRSLTNPNIIKDTLGDDNAKSS